MSAIQWSASASDRVVSCPASSAMSRVNRVASPEARWGIHVHKFMQDAVCYDRVYALARVDESVRSCCERVSVGDVLEELAGEDGICWVETEVPMLYCPEDGSAAPLSGIEYRGYPTDSYIRGIPGTADLILLTRTGRLIVVDYKTGVHPPRARNSWQLAVLALAATKLQTTIGGAPSLVTVAIVAIGRDGVHTIDRHDITPGELHQNEATVGRAWDLAMEAAEDIGAGDTPTVSTGDHCQYCPAMAACPAYTSLARQLGSGELDGVADRVALMTPVEAGAAWEKLSRAKKVVDAIDKALRGRIAAEGGRLPMPDGREVRTTSMNRRSIDGRLALPVLRDMGLDPHVTLTASAVESAAADAGLIAEEAFNALTVAGAMSMVRTECVRVCR